MSDDVTTYQLKRPIKVPSFSRSNPSNLLVELDVRRPSVKDLAHIDMVPGQVAKAVRLLSALTGLPEFVIEQIDCEDFDQLQKLIAPYIALAQGDGMARTATLASA